MNKKTLVQQVLEQMEKAEVVFDKDTRVRTEGRFWDYYPEGHYATPFYYCVEEHLSCLDENSLQQILELAPYSHGITFGSLWKAWGRAGCFKCKPTILTWGNRKAPVLRIRHDSYLHYMRGYAFQNSYDAHCNGSNGESSNLHQDIRAISLSPYALDEEQDEDAQYEAWEKKWALFRKAMIVQHPFVACGGRQTFYAMLDEYPEVFEEFINLTDSQVLSLNLDPTLTLEEMRKQCKDQPYDWRRGVFELALMYQNQCYGRLRFGETSVSFTWRRNKETHCSTIDFPEWDKQSYFSELYDIGDMASGVRPEQLSQREYLHACWNGLATMLLSLEGVSISQGYCVPRRGWELETTTVCLDTPNSQVQGMTDLWDKVSEATRIYPGFKQLAEEFMSKG